MADIPELKAALESILFVADRPVELTELRRILDVPREALEDLIAILSADYQERGIRIARLKDSIRMVSASECAPYVQAFLGLEQTVRFSSAALETLAIIAFRQPVTRAHIEAIRGVNSDGVIDTLEGRGLIEEAGRLESPGRPVLYGTTMAFLQHFGLQSLDELRPPDAAPAPEATSMGAEGSSEPRRLAGRLRGVAERFRAAIEGAADEALRRRPAEKEWSAVEVLGHIVDKMTIWHGRAETVAREERPFLADYDQDATVRDRNYQQADAGELIRQIEASCQRFAQFVEALDEEALIREGVHEESGPITLRICMEAPLNSVDEHLDQLRAAIRSSTGSQ